MGMSYITLRDLFDASDLTPTEAATLMGLTRQQVWNIIEAKSNTTIDRLHDLADVIGAPRPRVVRLYTQAREHHRKSEGRNGVVVSRK